MNEPETPAPEPSPSARIDYAAEFAKITSQYDTDQQQPANDDRARLVGRATELYGAGTNAARRRVETARTRMLKALQSAEPTPTNPEATTETAPSQPATPRHRSSRQQAAHDRNQARFAAATDPTDPVRRTQEFRHQEARAAQTEAMQVRTEAAYGMLYDAAHNKEAADALYAMGQSDDPENRARATIAESGLRFEKRAQKARQVNARIRVRVLEEYRDLSMANTSVRLNELLTAGEDIPKLKKPPRWQVWKR